MTTEEREALKEKLWQQIFALQKQACIAPLCLLDKLTFSDVSDQLKRVLAEEQK